MKVKNIMFFGFAAAILSAGAASAAATATFSPAVSAPDAAGRQIVSSKSYVDSVATNIAGQLKSVAVTGNYNDLDNKPTIPTAADFVEDSITDGVTNKAPSENAVYDALAGKQNTLTFDNTPTEDSNNPVTSGGVYTAINTATAASNFVEDSITDGVTNKAPSENAVYDALAGKQNTLTFDNTPTEDSNNPVTSGGVYTALDSKQDTLTFDNTPTEDSNNPVTSGGVYTAINTATAASNFVEDSITDGVTNKAPSENAVYDALANKQGLLGGGTAGTVLTNSGTAGNVTATTLATVATSGQYSDLTGTPTAADAISDVIPAKPDFCTDTNPCILMQDANGYNWYSMATDSSTTRQVTDANEKSNS